MAPLLIPALPCLGLFCSKDRLIGHYPLHNERLGGQMQPVKVCPEDFHSPYTTICQLFFSIYYSKTYHYKINLYLMLLNFGIISFILLTHSFLLLKLIRLYIYN